MVFCIIWIDNKTFKYSHAKLVVTRDHDRTDACFLSNTNASAASGRSGQSFDQTREDRGQTQRFQIPRLDFVACLISHHQDSRRACLAKSLVARIACLSSSVIGRTSH